MKVNIQKYAPHMRNEVLNLKLREEDAQEVYSSSLLTPKEAIASSIDCGGYLYVIKEGRTIIAIFGVSILDYETGIPWLLGSNRLHEIKYQIIKYSKTVLKVLMYPDNIKCLTNYISTTHQPATVKWLKWLGFTMTDTDTYLSDPKVPFKQFYRWKE